MSSRRQARNDKDDKPVAHGVAGDETLPAIMEVGGFALLAMVGASRVFNETMRCIGRIAMCDASSLIDGETGSGKELAARAIHYLGARRDRPFIPVNCGAIPDTLIEAEFFGHSRGAFTDARESRAGLISQAHGGTLFLDEIDALTPKAQISLLRFLQDQKYRPVGRDVELQADVRVIAATNKPVDELAAGERFRRDLLYRLNILYLKLPPLRERDGDAELLAQHFLRQYTLKYNLPPKRFSPEALRWIRSHRWPGNVRELENKVHRALLLAEGDIIEFGEVAPAAQTPTQAAEPGIEEYTALAFRNAKAKAIEHFERAYLATMLQVAQGNVSVAARMAKKERRAFGKLIKKYSISPAQFS